MECANRCANHILWLQVPGNRQGVTLDARELTSRFTKPPSKPKEINHEMCLRVWSSDCSLIGMDYEKMKAFLETSREESAAQHTPAVKEFPKPALRPHWKYLDHLDSLTKPIPHQSQDRKAGPSNARMLSP